MKLIVDQNLCIACGACISICPDVFDWNDDGKSDAIKGEIEEDLEDDAMEALESCPTEAIKEEEE